MTKVLHAIFAIVMAFSCFTAIAQETTLKVGVVATRPGDPPVTQDLSTAEVDALLNQFLPSQFGAHFTRDKANAAVARVEAMRTQLNSRLAAMDLGPDLDVTSVSVNANPVHVSFEQTPSGVRVTISGLSVAATARYTKYNVPLLCESVNGRFNLDYISVSADYDIPTGTLQNLQAGYALTNVSTSCSGLLGAFGDVLRDIFNRGDSFARAQVLEELRSAVGQLQVLNMRTIFSISDFLEGLRNFSNIRILNEIANEAIDKGQQIVANPSSLNRAFRLTVSVGFGPAGNTVSFIASHAEETPFELQYGVRGYTLLLHPPGNTSQVTIFARPPNTTAWYEIATVPSGTGSYFIRGGMAVGTQILTIGHNRTSSRLRSLGGQVETVMYDPTCTHLCEPIEPF